MAKLPIITSNTETYPGPQPEIVPLRAAEVTRGISRMFAAVPAEVVSPAQEAPVLNSTMTEDQKRAVVQNLEPFTAEADPMMPSDMYIEALASATSSGMDTPAPLDTANSDLMGTALAALDDIFGPRSKE